MKKAINAINQIDNMVDLNKAIAALKAKQKALRASLVASKKAKFTAGQIDNINSTRGNLTGTIVKLNRTKAVVEINGKQWNCPISIMEVA